MLGAADLKDGWALASMRCVSGKTQELALHPEVDGHVNLEEVLSAWAPAMLGMRARAQRASGHVAAVSSSFASRKGAGQRRRVLVPGRLGFRDGGEARATAMLSPGAAKFQLVQALAANADLSVDIELKQLG